MTKRPEVLIVGAGVIGCSIAWHLASRGLSDVRVIDRGLKLGAGSTSRATGGYRAQFGTDINVRLSLLAREKLRHFADEVGGDPGYRPCGYLWLARTEEELRVLSDAQRVQHAAGLTEARMADRGEIASLNPPANLDGIVG